MSKKEKSQEDAPAATPPAAAAAIEDPRLKELEERAAAAEKAAAEATAKLDALSKERSVTLEVLEKADAGAPEPEPFNMGEALIDILQLPEAERIQALKELPTRPTKAQLQRAHSDILWAQHPEVIFVDSMRNEWPAKICPLPLNKHEVVILPAVTDMQAEMQKIADMPVQHQMAAFQDLHKRQLEGAPHLQTGSKTFHKVCRFHGMAMYASEINGNVQPTPHLMVNFAKSEESEEWVTMSYVRFRDFVAIAPAAKGHTTPHWKFKEDDPRSRGE